MGKYHDSNGQGKVYYAGGAARTSRVPLISPKCLFVERRSGPFVFRFRSKSMLATPRRFPYIRIEQESTLERMMMGSQQSIAAARRPVDVMKLRALVTYPKHVVHSLACQQIEPGYENSQR